MVREPTREKYLSDLTLTDVANCSSTVLAYIADHKMVMSQLPLPEILETSVSREVWVFAKADWNHLSEALGDFNWKKDYATFMTPGWRKIKSPPTTYAGTSPTRLLAHTDLPISHQNTFDFD